MSAKKKTPRNERSASITARALLDFVEENAGEMVEGLEAWDRDIFWTLYHNYLLTRDPRSDGQRRRTHLESHPKETA